jgi:hypothetical protein
MKEIINKHVIDWVEDNILSLEHIDRLVVKTGYSRRTLEIWFNTNSTSRWVSICSGDE